MKRTSTLISWSSIDSQTDHTEGISEFAKAIAKSFAPISPAIDFIDLPSRRVWLPSGHSAHRAVGPGLQISSPRKKNAAIRILLCGHMDTVLPAREVKQLDQERLNGSGVADMKGGLVILLSALLALEESKEGELVEWEVCLNPDEEVGSPSSTAWLQGRAGHFDVGLVFEPQLDSSYVGERMGSINYALVSKGKAAHAGRDFAKGKNALAALLPVLQNFTKLPHLNLGRIDGGGPTNVVPDLAVAHLNLRAKSAEELEAATALLRKETPEEMELIVTNARKPKRLSAADHKLYALLATCTRELRQPFSLESTGGVCDGNTLAAAGLPTIDTLGAVGGNLHTEEEFLLLSSLKEKAAVATLLLKKLGAHGPVTD